jgi:hypothetical protein
VTGQLGIMKKKNSCTGKQGRAEGEGGPTHAFAGVLLVLYFLVYSFTEVVNISLS